MTDVPDNRLLEQFARNSSEEAFAVLVQRHIALVHSVAMRHTANPQHAQDITQAVFVILARKAGVLGRKTVLSGWLYHTARLTAANLQRAETRRVRREQEAFMQSKLEEFPTDALWRELSPQLDEAMAGLGTAERDALVLRYFQNKSMAEVAKCLGLEENTAQKRVSRALEKLRKFFTKRGVDSTTTAIAENISAHSVQAVPVALAKAVTAVALAKGTTASISTLTLIKGALKIMAWTKAKTAIGIGAAAILAGGTAITISEIAAPSGTDAERRPVVMQTQWQIGKKYLMHKEDVQITDMKNPGQSKPVKRVQKQSEDLYFFPVRKLDNGGWQLQLEFESLALAVTNGNRLLFAADSAQNPAQDALNPLGARLRKMTGARLEYFTDANGKVEQMNGYQELVTHVAGENQLEQAAFKDLFSEIALEKYGSVGEDTVPRRVVKLGDRWTVKLKVPSNGGNLNVDVKCAFKNWEQRADHKCMHITFTGTISAVAGADASTLRVKIEKGKVSGDIWFDPELGMAVESAQNVDVQLKINQNGQIQIVPLNEKTRATLIAVEDV